MVLIFPDVTALGDRSICLLSICSTRLFGVTLSASFLLCVQMCYCGCLMFPFSGYECLCGYLLCHVGGMYVCASDVEHLVFKFTVV